MSIRVYQLAKELGILSKDLIVKLHSLKIDVKAHMSTLDDETAEIIRQELLQAPPIKVSAKVSAVAPKRIQVKFPIAVKELSAKLQTRPNDIIKKLIEKGAMVNINQSLEEEVAKNIAKGFGVELERLPTMEESLLKSLQTPASIKLLPRAPVVTFMGHVDHGKTSLLDAIRETNITSKEAGGITQHIGAYEVVLPNKGKVTFLDTPGHEAFTAMRARGANITDVVVLVVAADDGIMPQTIEAIDHARAANVPMVVAINKIDKPEANPDRVKKQLMELGLLTEEWGGKTVTVGVSAKTKEGLERLLEMLLLEAELLELKANHTGFASGTVIESRLESKSGPIVTVLVQNGILRVGDTMIAGQHYGNVRAMTDCNGHRIKESFPSTPVEILGFSGVCDAGAKFFVVENEKKAKDIILERQSQMKRAPALLARLTLQELHDKIQKGEVEELNLIIKSDVQGSLGAIKESLGKLGTKAVSLKIIHGGIGDINESDIMLAAASNAIVIGFHVDITAQAKMMAYQEGVDVHIYKIIYEVTEAVRLSMEGLLKPVIEETLLGRAQVKQAFKLSKTGTIAGCLVTDGKITRGALIRVHRDKQLIYEGKASSLKRFKEDVKEILKGMECGIGLSGFEDIKEGDTVEAFETKEVAGKL